MKSNYLSSKSEIRRIAKEEIAKQEAERCPGCMKNVGYQTLATVFWVLHRDWGFGAKRLQKLKNDVESEFLMMETGIPWETTIEYNANMLVQALKEFGIDFDESQYEGDDMK